MSTGRHAPRRPERTQEMRPLLLDPRAGDVEDDASSTKSRSLLAIAGSLLAEISLPKLVVAWGVLILLPALLLGAAPLIAGGWISGLSGRLADIAGAWPILVLAPARRRGCDRRPAAVPARRSGASGRSIRSPCSRATRSAAEALRHVGERVLGSRPAEDAHARMRGASAVGGGIIACAVALVFVAVAWPHTRWHGTMADLATPLRLVAPALANAVVLLGAYLAGASLVWGLADAHDGPAAGPRGVRHRPGGPRRWRVAHLSDIHVVGERYGFRIESGRAGPRGNDRLAQASRPAGGDPRREPAGPRPRHRRHDRCRPPAEWAEFLDLLAAHPGLAALTLVLPGNHDLNIVDRANPARLDLPTSPNKRLRQMRTLAAMAAVQGPRVRRLDPGAGRARRDPVGGRGAAGEAIARFADRGGLAAARTGCRSCGRAASRWSLPPAAPDGLGVIVLNSNAETHFSFTNALGLVSAEQMRGRSTACSRPIRVRAGSWRCTTTWWSIRSRPRRSRSGSARR